MGMRKLHARRVVSQIKGKHRVFGTGPHVLYWRHSVVAVVLMFVLKINSSIRITKSQSCLWKHTRARQSHLHGRSGLGLYWWVAQPGRGWGGAATLSPSLKFTDGTVFCTSVFDLQGTGRYEKALEKRVLELDREDSEEGQLPWFNALFLPRFFVLLLPPRSRFTTSLCSGSLSLRTQVYFVGCVLSAAFWRLFVMRPQGCLEVASVPVCALGFYLFLVPRVGWASSAWQVPQSLTEASQVDARAFLLRDLAHVSYLSLV